jgi:hypothetical protein
VQRDIMNFYKKNYFNPLQTILVSAFCVSLIASGCSDDRECDGDFVRCYNANGSSGVNNGRWCTSTDIPPCECYGLIFGNGWFFGIGDSKLDKFVNPPDPNNCDGVMSDPSGIYTPAGPSPVYINEPYEFDCPSFWNGNLCTQYETYYFDFTAKSYDILHRPIYVKFSNDNFNFEKYDYKFVLLTSTDSELETVTISKRFIDQEVLRSLSPSFCVDEAGCHTEGTIKINAQNISYKGTYKIVMYEIDSKNPSIVNQKEITTFEVLDYDGDQRNQYRIFDLVMYKNGEFDLSSYSIGERDYVDYSNQLNVLNYTFGDGQSNLRFSSQTRDLESKYVDGLGNMILRKDEFISSRINKNPYLAMEQWIQKVYFNTNFTTIKPMGFGVEVNTLRVYDFELDPPQPDFSYNDNGELDLGILGFTGRNGPFETYYNGGVVLRSAINTTIGILKPNGQYFSSDLSLRTFLHELGHMWSSKAVNDEKNDQCSFHTNFCTGVGRYYCLFQTACVGSIGSDVNPYDAVDYFLKNVQRPKFCEGHQQIFMNQLINK